MAKCEECGARLGSWAAGLDGAICENCADKELGAIYAERYC